MQAWNRWTGPSLMLPGNGRALKTVVYAVGAQNQNPFHLQAWTVHGSRYNVTKNVCNPPSPALLLLLLIASPCSSAERGCLQLEIRGCAAAVHRARAGGHQGERQLMECGGVSRTVTCQKLGNQERRSDGLSSTEGSLCSVRKRDRGIRMR